MGLDKVDHYCWWIFWREINWRWNKRRLSWVQLVSSSVETWVKQFTFLVEVTQIFLKNYCVHLCYAEVTSWRSWLEAWDGVKDTPLNGIVFPLLFQFMYIWWQSCWVFEFFLLWVKWWLMVCVSKFKCIGSLPNLRPGVCLSNHFGRV